jgi:peptidylprolyl isomerase
MRFLSCLFALLVGLSATLSAPAARAEPITDPENTLVMMLKTGRVVIALRPDLAPHTVMRVKQLTRQGFYDGTPFHRVIEGFMAQGGDPTGSGIGGSGFKLAAEFSAEPFLRGTVSMARASGFDSADSQFFICLADSHKLDGKYTIFGKVIDGMDNVDEIKKGDEAKDGRVTAPDRIIWMKVASDVKE